MFNVGTQAGFENISCSQTQQNFDFVVVVVVVAGGVQKHNFYTPYKFFCDVDDQHANTFFYLDSLYEGVTRRYNDQF